MSGLRVVLAANLCLVLLAACGSSSGPQPSATVPVIAPGGTPTTTTGSATTPPTATTPTAATGSRRPPPCRTAGLALRLLGTAGATGHGELGFAMRNVSGRRCRTYGYPGILFLGKAGRPLPTTTTRTTVDFFGNTTKTELVVAPGAEVSFRLGVSHGAGVPAACTTAYGLQVIAPDDTVATRTTMPSGAYECGGQATVSPLQPADTAFSG